MGNYAHQRLTPMQKPEWNSLMLQVDRHDHRAFLATLYYWALRNGEARTLEAKHFIIEDSKIYLNLRKRLKGSRSPEPMGVQRTNYGIIELIGVITNHPTGPLFPFSRQTAWRICHRYGYYPHFFRMSRITMTLQKYGVPGVKQLLKLPIQTIDYYSGYLLREGMEIE
jgi:integrase